MIPNDQVGRAGFLATVVIASLALLVIVYGLLTGSDGRDAALIETTTGAASSTENDWLQNPVQTFASTSSELSAATAVPLAPTVTPFATTPTATPAPTGAEADAPAANTTAGSGTTTETETASDESGTSEDAETSSDTTDGQGDTTDSAGEADTTDAETSATATPEPTAEPTADAEPTATAEPTPTPTPGPPPVPRSSAFTYTLRATGDVQVAEVFDAPDGNPVQVTYEYLDGNVVQNDLINPTHFESPLVFRVLEGNEGDEWAKVSLPTRPNGQTGWIKTENYNWGSSNFLVQIDIGTNRVAIFDGEELVLETQAVTGTDASPTPILSGYVDDKVYGRGGAYGPVILSLGVFSNALNTFGSNGESPKIALHGTNQPELMGQYESNGCIRVPNDVIEQISNLVPVGSKVEIIST